MMHNIHSYQKNVASKKQMNRSKSYHGKPCALLISRLPIVCLSAFFWHGSYVRLSVLLLFSNFPQQSCREHPKACEKDGATPLSLRASPRPHNPFVCMYFSSFPGSGVPPIKHGPPSLALTLSAFSGPLSNHSYYLYQPLNA